jgi:hypothetical protein
MSIYDATAQRILAQITRKGATVTFPTNTGGVYDPATDSWSGGTAGTATGRGVQIANDLTQLQALGIVNKTTITLLVAARGLTATPEREEPMSWAGVTYSIADVQTTAPDGTPLLYQIVGVA